MKKMRKIISLVLIFAMTIVMFTGCKVTSQEDKTDTTDTSDEVVEQDEDEADDTPKKFEGETVTVLSHDNPYTRSLAALADDFKKETGATLKLDPVGQQIMEQRIQLDFASQSGSVDVAYMPLIFTSKWATAGWVKPLDDHIEKDNVEVDMDDFIVSAVDALTYEDTVYGLPGFAEPALMAYRLDILKEHGFEEGPKTWDELLAMAEVINTKETAAVSLRSQRGQGLNMFIFPMLMWGYGGGFFEDFPEDMKLAIDTPENKEALDIYTTLVSDFSPDGGGNYTNSDVIASMQAGTSAIIIDGTSIINEATAPDNNQFSDDIELSLIPEGPAGSSPAFAVHGWALPTFSENDELGWEFIKWATSAETQKKIAMGVDGEVYLDYTRESVGNDPEVLEKYNDMNMATLRNQALETTQWDYRPLINEWVEIGDVLAGHINAAANKQVSSEEALEQAENDLYDILKKAGYEVD